MDPFAWLSEGIVTNTGIFQLGQPGTGKSAFAKRQMVGLVAQGVRPVVVADSKGEYTELVRRIGGQVIRLGPGLDRLNPLQIADASRGQKSRAGGLSLLMALCAVARRGPVTNGEQVILSAAVDTLARGGGEPVLPDLLQLLRNPTQEVLDVADVGDIGQFQTHTRELRWTIGLLCDGPLKGVFDGPSSITLDQAAPAVAIDVSAIDDEALLAATMLTGWHWGQTAVAQAPGRSMLVMDELWRALRGGPSLVEHADALTRLNRSRGVASLMITHSMRDLEALPDAADVAKARGFVERSAIVVLSGLPRRELEELSQVIALSRSEISLVASWASPQGWRPGSRHPGRGKYLIKTGSRPGLPVAMGLTDSEADLYNTDPR
ncbi:MAG: hypothetical protein MUD05_05450 [Candidatus Nanopelagicales bacterium]|nr:hypothetical protein [Candidatus Nanopelagicales bacterium]